VTDRANIVTDTW